MRAETAPEAAPLKPPAPTVIDARTTEIRVEEHWTEASAPPHPAAPRAEVPPAMVREEVRREIEPRPEVRIEERELHTETVRAERAIERETIRVEAPQPSARLEAEAIDGGEIERHVLGKLMPALDAWFHSGRPKPRSEAPARPPLAPSRQQPAESVAPAAEAPQLVIGSIRVEVVPPPAPVSAPAPRSREPHTAPRPARQMPSRAGFGLGQM
jgi:hypothetical protein